MKEYIIYLHRNKINGKVYIGQTCRKPERRYGAEGIYYKKCKRFYSAIQHYGWDNFEHIILKTGLTKEQADEYEKFYIIEYKSSEPEYGYNLLEGGSNLSNYWDKIENREKQSKDKKIYINEHPEVLEKMIKHSHTAEINEQKSILMKQRYANQENSLYAINEKRKNQVECVESGEVFPSITTAAQAKNISAGCISMAISGKRKIAGGYHWRKIIA